MTDLFRSDQLAADQPTGLGTAMVGGKGRLDLDKTARRALDFYPTPPDCTRALLIAERHAIAGHGAFVWECCGRGGAIADVLREFRLASIASDIVADPEHDVIAQDVLHAAAALAPVVVTNPPFAIAAAIVSHLLGDLGVRYLALLLKQTFWQTDTESGRGRLGLWRDFPPSRRWDLTWRPDFTGGRSSTMACSWFVWDAGTPRDALPPGMVPWGLLNRMGPVGFGRPPELFHEERP